MFTTPIFVFVFLPMIWVGYLVIASVLKQVNYAVVFVLLASILFYSWQEPVMVLGLVFSAGVNIWLGYVQKMSKLRLTVGIVFNIVLLVSLKFSHILFSPFLFSQAFWDNWAVPLGVSFYTFHAISFLVERYNQKSALSNIWLHGISYFVFFPYLVAGPIMLYRQVFQPRLYLPSTVLIGEGVQRFIVGMAKKVLLANYLKPTVDTIFTTPAQQLDISVAWGGLLITTVYIYIEFSGYTDMAIGLGKMFGVVFPENFNFPYLATSLTDFWRRWHMSLMAWLKEYVYLPLGGHGDSEWKMYRNLVLVFLLSGLWHGSTGSYLLWGLYMGVTLCIEKRVRKYFSWKLPAWLRTALTLIVVSVGWSIFFSSSAFAAVVFIQKLLGLLPSENLTVVWKHIWLLKTQWVIVIAILVSMSVFSKIKDFFSYVIPGPYFSWLAYLVYCGLLILSVLEVVGSTYQPFLYAQF